MYRHVNLTDFVQITFLPNGQEKITHFQHDEVLRLRTYCPSGGYYSLPSWIGVNGMLELVRSAISWNERFFLNHTLPEFAILTKGLVDLTEVQKDTIKSFFQREYQGIENAHRTLHLHLSDPESTIDFKELQKGVKDGDFLKMLDACTERIHIAHGVPPRLLGIISAGSLAGGGELIAQLFMFEKFFLGPRRRQIRGQILPLLKELGISKIEFNKVDLTPPDVDNANITEWTRSGIISNEEARELFQIDERQGLTKSDYERSGAGRRVAK